MVGTKIPKHLLEAVKKEENGKKYVLKSETYPANEVGSIPDGRITFDIVLSKNPQDERDWFDEVSLRSLQKTEETMETNCVCRSKVVSVDEVFYLPQKSRICDFNRTYSPLHDEYRYRITYLIPRPKPEKPFEGFEWL